MGPVTLAWLWLEGQTLIVVANSVERYRRLKLWVDRLPGVRFHQVRQSAADEPPPLGREGASSSGGIPIPPGPSELAAVQEQIDAYYERWLDTSIPALGNKTPRAAVRSEAGRRQVQQLIRGIPAASGMGGSVAIGPNKCLLRKKLGLPEE